MRLPTSFGGRVVEYSGTGHGVYASISLKILASLSNNVVVDDFISRHPRRVVVAGVLVP
jgi:hypothetical protein